MSKEKEYRDYVKAYFPDVDTSKGVVAADVAKVLGLKANTVDPKTGQFGIPEFNFRASISAAIGAVEESKHGMKHDRAAVGGTKGTRYNEVPDRNAELHNRLSGELYDALTPLDV